MILRVRAANLLDSKFVISFMRVIILEDIPKFGRTGEVKEANDGYARNFLLPRGLAKPATAQSIALLERQKSSQDQKLSDETAKFSEMAAKLADMRLVITTKAGERGKVFGAITAAKIHDSLLKKNIQVDKEWILLEEPIKQLGETTVKIKFPQGIEGQLRIAVEQEK